MKKESFLDRLFASIKTLRGSPQGELQTATGSLVTENIDALRGLSPARVAQILNDADNGDIVEQHRLFANVEDEDEHIFTEISKRSRALVSLNWEIRPAVTYDGAGKKKAEAMAETVRGLFDAIPGYEDTILAMATGIGHGFAPLEIEWGMDGKYHVPVALHARPQQWFQLERETRRLQLRAGFEGEDLRPLGWIIHEHKSKSGWFARFGLFRVLMTTYLLKKYARSGFAEFLEIHGLPLRVGKYPGGATDKEKTNLLNGLRMLGRDAAAIVPDGMELEFVEAVKASESPYSTLWDKCEKGQSKAILGGTLTTQADGLTSTNALGNIHNDVRRDLRNSDAVQIAATLTHKLLLPLAALNCGLQDPKLAPYFVFETTEPEDLEQLASALPKLVQVMEIPAAWAHEKTRIPVPEEGEKVLQMRGAAQAPPEMPEKKDSEEEKKEEARAALPTREGAAAAAREAERAGFARLLQTLEEDETRLESGLESIAGTYQGHMETMLAPLFAAVQDGLPPEALMARLASLYPELDAAALQEQMARVFFVAELWGRIREDSGSAGGA